MKLIDALQERQEAASEIDNILFTASKENRALTEWDQKQLVLQRTKMTESDEVIRAARAKNTMGRFPAAILGGGGFGAGAPATTLATVEGPSDERSALVTSGYTDALRTFLTSGGKAHNEELVAGADGVGGYYVPGSEQFTQQRRANGYLPKMSAAMFEGTNGGSDSSGGFAVSVPTVDQIVPLSLPDLGLFDAATVVATVSDIKIPQQASFGTSALKAESNGTIATFGGSDPTLGQIELTSFMAGALRMASWELLQDVKTFQEFIVSDLIRGQRILEGQLLCTGTGSGQPLGVFGNTGTGTGSAYEMTGASTDAALLLNSLFDVVSTLRASYQPNAAWIMNRSTGLAIRRAQMQANLFAPVVTVDPDGTERILGRPVFYDTNAPSLPTATNAGVIPILYGDFKQGYIVGVRGGSGINVKILDQPWAAQGQLGILAYRRIDGKVRRSEAIQAITFSHS